MNLSEVCKPAVEGAGVLIQAESPTLVEPPPAVLTIGLAPEQHQRVQRFADLLRACVLSSIDKPEIVPTSLVDLLTLFRAWESTHEKCSRNIELESEIRSYQEGKRDGIELCADMVEQMIAAKVSPGE